MPLEQELEVHPSDTTSPSSQFGQDNHRAFIDGIEVCAERFADDEESRVTCFAEVVSTTIGRRALSRRTVRRAAAAVALTPTPPCAPSVLRQRQPRKRLLQKRPPPLLRNRRLPPTRSRSIDRDTKEVAGVDNHSGDFFMRPSRVLTG